MSSRRWLSRIRPFVLHRRRRIAQGPYWASVRDESEACEWLNTLIRKMWPVYDHPVCTCAPRHHAPHTRQHACQLLVPGPQAPCCAHHVTTATCANHGAALGPNSPAVLTQDCCFRPPCMLDPTSQRVTSWLVCPCIVGGWPGSSPSVPARQAKPHAPCLVTSRAFPLAHQSPHHTARSPPLHLCLSQASQVTPHRCRMWPVPHRRPAVPPHAVVGSARSCRPRRDRAVRAHGVSRTPNAWRRDSAGHAHPDTPRGTACRTVIGAVDPILRNVKPPLFLSLKIHRLKFGSRSPEVVSMRTFSVSRRRVVFHARVRFVGDDLQAVLVGLMLTGRVFAGAPCPFPCCSTGHSLCRTAMLQNLTPPPTAWRCGDVSTQSLLRSARLLLMRFVDSLSPDTAPHTCSTPEPPCLDIPNARHFQRG